MGGDVSFDPDSHRNSAINHDPSLRFAKKILTNLLLTNNDFKGVPRYSGQAVI